VSGVITIITDLGEKGFYLGSVKGAILKEFPKANIIDITKSITHFEISEAVYVLKNSWHHFPEKTVHLVLVENRTITARKILAAEHENHFFVAPDNGILSLFFEERNLKIFEIDKRELNPSNNTLPSRLLMAVTAAKIAAGTSPADIGKLKVDLFRKTSPPPVVTPNSIRGSVIYTDGFSNVITDITQQLFDEVGQNRQFNLFVKRKENERHRSESITLIHKDYSDVPEGEKVFHFNSTGNLVVSINKGKATSLLGLMKDSIINIEFQ
jgi:S-adenosyl-L-methionine hydrolase (adenosine-forming)